jgi:hypothetical protein
MALREHPFIRWSCVFGTVALLASIGCRSLARPKWLEPGPSMNQQRRAVRFDPYLQDDTAPAILRVPLNDGTRPRDFAEPMPEVERSRWWSAVR